MMFEESMLSAVINQVVNVWKNNGLYYFIMLLPFLIIATCIGVVVAIVFDFFVSLNLIFK